MADTIRHRIVKKVQEFIEANDGREPTKVYLTRKEEVDFSALTYKEIGNVAQVIWENGVRKAIQDKGNTIFGMEVQWDAKEFKVE